MLVHKATMGVLETYWSGRYRTGPDGVRVPVMVEYTLDNAGLDPAEWWEVPAHSELGRRLRLAYPCCDPVVGADGQLADVVPWPRWKRDGEPEPEEEVAPIPAPKPRKRRQRRQSGLFAELLK